jgi:hypothetical protein
MEPNEMESAKDFRHGESRPLNRGRRRGLAFFFEFFFTENLKSMGHVKAFDNSHKVSPHTRSCFFIAKIGFTKEAHEIPPFVKLGPRGCTNGCRGF